MEGVNNVSSKERERRLAEQRVDRSHRKRGGVRGRRRPRPWTRGKGRAHPEPRPPLRSGNPSRRAVRPTIMNLRDFRKAPPYLGRAERIACHKLYHGVSPEAA